MRVAGYCRVSTTDQAVRGYSLEAQQQAIAAYATGRGWTVARWYVDAGISAYTDDPQKRPAFAALLADAAARQWDAAIVLKLDRLARSVRVAADALTHLREHACALISVSEGWDFGSISGQFLFNIMASLAQMESATNSERTKRGVAMRRSKGLWHGVVPWGGLMVDGRITVDPAKAALLAWALEALRRESFTTVAGELNRRGERTARGFVWRPFSLEQWLNHADWLLAQPAPWPDRVALARTRVRSGRTRLDRRTHMLTGLLYCACGGRLVSNGTWRRPDGTEGQSMRCLHYTPDRPTGAGCAYPQADREHYEAQATAYLLSLPDLTDEALLYGHDDTALAERRAELHARRQRLGLAFADGALDAPVYKLRLAALADEEAELPPPSAQAVTMGRGILLAQHHWGELLPEARNVFWRGHVERFVATGRELAAVPNAALALLLAAHAAAHPSG